MRRAKRLLAAACTSALLVGVLGSPALAVNDPFVPGEECAPDNSEAVGHPASAHEQSPVADAPFSLNNPAGPGGARAEEPSQGEAHCQNAPEE